MKKCGPASTTLSPPSVSTVSQAPGHSPTLSVTDSFNTVNDNCPVISHTLTSDATQIDLTAGADGSVYTVTMSEATNLVLGTYTWSLSAVAEGGATSTSDATGEMTVEIVCVASLVDGYEPWFSLPVPNPDIGTQVDSFPDGSTDYVTLPPRSASDSLPDGVECY